MKYISKEDFEKNKQVLLDKQKKHFSEVLTSTIEIKKSYQDDPEMLNKLNQLIDLYKIEFNKL